MLRLIQCNKEITSQHTLMIKYFFSQFHILFIKYRILQNSTKQPSKKLRFLQKYVFALNFFSYVKISIFWVLIWLTLYIVPTIWPGGTGTPMGLLLGGLVFFSLKFKRLVICYDFEKKIFVGIAYIFFKKQRYVILKMVFNESL